MRIWFVHLCPRMGSRDTRVPIRTRSFRGTLEPILIAFLVLGTFFGCAVEARCQQGDPDLSKAGNAQVAEIMKTYGGRGVMSDGSDPIPAENCVEQFQMREGLRMELVASEPVVEQPLFLTWDSRGRMWVVQYRQYQFPAGLKVVRYDQHLRAVFDKVPDPPPHGVPGRDKITVHTDTNGDGVYDQSKEVITGLNIASAVQVGRGGVWVLNPPYLLFYPDANGDDVADGDPEVHLTGFGLQDTHSVANSMMWGPDGWLYGANGSTTVGDVSSAVTKGVRFQGQCIWRYHPGTKVFEIYAEGGGNTFSLEIDSGGRVFAGTNGGNTRGWYFPQGSYSNKNWGKHGPLTNPFAFGFFSPMKFQGDGRRFPQAFCIYEGGLLGDEYAGTVVAPNAMHNLIWNSQMISDGSTYRTEDRINITESPDRWFRPVYSGVGPDGAVYLADWYDSRLSHVSPIDDWHKSSGRVYRVIPATSQGPVSYQEGDLSKASSEQLIAMFQHPNKWVRKRSVLELGWRGDVSVIEKLVGMVNQDSSLEALWALNLLDEFSTDLATKWLKHENADIRRWVVRLLGDRHESHTGFVTMATTEPEPQVRSQLAASSRRISADVAVPLLRELIRHEDDTTDPHIPLMIWWGLESHANQWPAIEKLLSDESVWRNRIFVDHLASRLMQRYGAAAGQYDLERCARLLDLAPDPESVERLLLGFNRAFQGRSLPDLPESLARALNEFLERSGNDALILKLRRRDSEAVDQALKLLVDRRADLNQRLAIVGLLGEVTYPKSVPVLLRLATGSGSPDPSLQRLSIRSLGAYDIESIGPSLVKAFGSRISEEHGLRATACRTLASRKSWAHSLLDELVAWRIKPENIPADVVQQLRSHTEPKLAAKVDRVFGKSLARSAPEKIAELKRLRKLVASEPGDAERGQLLFNQHCSSCHQLFGQGKKVGPPLDGYERGNPMFWLNAIVEPSLEIREGFQSYLILTESGRTLTGMIADQGPKSVTLRNAESQLVVVDREDIESLKALPTSLMPSDLLSKMTDQQIQDLFAYLSLGAKR